MSKLYNIFKLGASKIKPKTKPDKSKLDLIKSETKILKSKQKNIRKLADDVKENTELFKKGKGFKEGLGKFGFNKPSSKKK